MRSDPDLSEAVEIVPETDGAMSNSFYYRHSPTLVVTGDRIYLELQVGGPNELRVFALDGTPVDAPEQMQVSTIFGLVAGRRIRCVLRQPLLRVASAVVSVRRRDGATTKLAISSESPVDYSDVTVTREFATSRDGTRVPINILMPKGFEKDGSAAILVTGYGGYGLSRTPSMSFTSYPVRAAAWCFAQANLRGGGEYGETWHRAGQSDQQAECV